VWWIFAAFAAAVPAALAGVPATVTATGLGLALLALMVRDPGLGVASVVLGSGFLLGEYKNPYFLFAHGLALAALATAWARSGSEPRAAAPVPYWPPVVFLVTTILAVPLDLRTLLEDLWLGRWLDWQAILWRGLPDAAPLKPLERVGTVAACSSSRRGPRARPSRRASWRPWPPWSERSGRSVSCGSSGWFGPPATT
jgi:hypothetical protein